MSKRNTTQLSEFLLLGFSAGLNFQPHLFEIFLVIYIITFTGNMIIIIIVMADPHLQSPMYQFLRSLSLTEIFYISVTISRMLIDFLHQNKSISFIACAAQCYFFGFLGTTECFTLACMAYDRYVAICHPLNYTTVMTKAKCNQILAGSWLSGVILALGQVFYMFSLPFCNASLINHFFCDILPVVKLACTSAIANEIATVIYSSLVVPVPFLLVLVSYTRIIISVLKIPAAVGKKKTFSTCSSHLASVSLFYGSLTINYLRTKSVDSHGETKILSLLYVVFIPMLNPLTYSLRNEEMKKSHKKTLQLNKGILTKECRKIARP